MGFMPTGVGITKLSELIIDADKDWDGKGITELKELALSMTKGDILFRGTGGVLVKLSPGPISDELTSHGQGQPVQWEAPPSKPAPVVTVPTMVTDDATEITVTAAVLNGRMTDNGGEDADHIYFDWDTDSGEPYAHTEDLGPGGEGNYEKEITGLSEGTPYYFRIRAHNSKGESCGTEKTFTTETIVPPTMVTHDADEITDTAAKMHGEVQDTGWEPPNRYLDWYNISGWLSGYSYRQQITINATAVGAQTDYQMKLTVHKGVGASAGSDCYLDNHAENWPDDIRFTKPDGTLLDYWLESDDGTNAVIWIEFDSIPASGSVNFYIYYGKTGGASASDFDATRKPISTIAEVCDDIAHASATNIKAVLEGAGYTVTLVTDDDVVNDVVDLSGYDMIVCVRTQNDLAGLGAKLRGYCDNHIPLMAGIEEGLTPGTYTVSQLIAINYTAQVRSDNSEDEVVITDNSHYITSVFSLGDLIIATANEFLESIEKANSVGASLADRKGYLDYSGVQVIEAATLDLSSVAFGQRVCHIGFLYRNTSDDGNTLILRAVKWTGFRNYVTPEPTWGAWGAEETFEGGEENCGVGGVGPYEKAISGLTPETAYYFKARGVNSGGTGTGVEKEFTTLAS